MTEVIVLHEGREVYRLAAGDPAIAPETAEGRAAITHALASAIAAVALLPSPCRHGDLLREIADRMLILDPPGGASVLDELGRTTEAHCDAIDRTIAFIESVERTAASALN